MRASASAISAGPLGGLALSSAARRASARSSAEVERRTVTFFTYV
jgi:hypothetical protein